MKLPHAALLIGLSTALLFGAALDVSAQFQLGVHGTLADIKSVSGGVGGRLGYFQPASASGTEFGVEAAYGIFFPSCIGLECDSSGGHAVLVASQTVGYGAQTYLGAGARYQDFDLDDGTESVTGAYWGFMILFGSRMNSDQPLSPFFELGWSFMDTIPDIWDFTLGVRFQMGG